MRHSREVREDGEVVGAVREMQTPSIGVVGEGRGIPPRLPHILRSGCLGLDESLHGQLSSRLRVRGVAGVPEVLVAVGFVTENEESLPLQSACAFHPRVPCLLPQQGSLRRRASHP